MTDGQSMTEKQKQRYERILLVAEEMIYNGGFYKLSLSQLTARVGVSRSTIYEYFGSKEGLVEAVVDRLGERLDNGLNTVISDNSLTTRDKFISLAKTQSNSLDLNCYKLFNELKIHMPETYKKFEKRRKKREQNGYGKLVKQGVKEGLFDKSLPIDFLIQLYLKMGQLLSDTDIQEHVSMTKSNAMETIIKIYLNGAKKIKRI